MILRSEVVAVLIACVVLSAAPLLAEGALHETETAAAWEAFQKKDYVEAIRHADICIDEFFGAANRRQKDLDGQKARLPNGKVTQKQKESITSNGVLNDVATCHYIRARSLAMLDRKEEAAAAIQETAKYPGARAWDPRGWYWSPTEAAEIFLKHPELGDHPFHLVYTTLAWDEFNAKRYVQAAAWADKCIEQFSEIATEMEQDFQKRNVLVPNGVIRSEAIRQEILSHGALNDVSACLFIKGKASESLKNRRAAITAYGQALKLPRGRCYDPKGWFWSPAEVAQDRLQVIQR